MPILKSRPSPNDDNNRQIQFGAILEKIRRGGSQALNNNERIIIVELFRSAAITNDKRLLKLRDEISVAHLEFCFRIPTGDTRNDP
jgi:hypothetical protein